MTFTLGHFVLVAQAGLHEATETLNAQKKGIEENIDFLAEIAGKVEKPALEAAYGATIDPAVVQNLWDAIGSFQEESRVLITQYRAESTAAANEIEKIAEEGRQREIEAITAYVSNEEPGSVIVEPEPNPPGYDIKSS